MAKSRPDAPPAALPDLNNRTIPYIGGRLQAVAHFKRLVEACNGSFSHHDGGMEESMGRLKSLFGRADAVIFPVDCVSHAALAEIKRLCRRWNKPPAAAPFRPLRPAPRPGKLCRRGQGPDDSTQRLIEPSGHRCEYPRPVHRCIRPSPPDDGAPGAQTENYRLQQNDFPAISNLCRLDVSTPQILEALPKGAVATISQPTRRFAVDNRPTPLLYPPPRRRYGVHGG